jgi:hypothetical protein
MRLDDTMKSAIMDAAAEAGYVTVPELRQIVRSNLMSYTEAEVRHSIAVLFRYLRMVNSK